MDLVRRNDFFAPFLETFFSDPFFKVTDQRKSDWSPRIDIIEQDDKFVVEVEAPGLSKDDINISLENGILVVSGTKTARTELKNDTERYYQRESYVGTFTRSIRVPQSVNEDDISAKMADGVLTISLPKSPGSLTRKIDIE